MNERKLTQDEKYSLRRILDRDEDTTVVLWGEGKYRTISFHAANTRLETRIPLPDTVEER